METTFAAKIHDLIISISAGNCTEILKSKSASELVRVHNEVLAYLGEPGAIPVKRFSDKRTAVRRTYEVLKRLSKSYALKEEKAPETPAKKKKPAKSLQRPRKARGMRFIFPATGEVKKVRPNTHRGKLVEMLSTEKGATFEECLAATWANVPSMDEETQRKTCYEAIRLLHYYVGYGMKQDSEGRITIYQ